MRQAHNLLNLTNLLFQMWKGMQTGFVTVRLQNDKKRHNKSGPLDYITIINSSLKDNA